MAIAPPPPAEAATPATPATPTPAPTPAPAGAAAPAQSAAPPASSGTFIVPENPASGIESLNSGPSLRALPVDPSDQSTTYASTHRKFYTLTASLREIYDGNVSTSNTNQQASLETDVTPSVLVNFPTTDGTFTGRYSLLATYYTNAPNFTGNGSSSNPGGNNNNSTLDISHEVDAQYSRAITNRVQLGLAEDFRYFTEPSILESTGTNYQSGAYISNTLTGTLSVQLTPLWSAALSYANTVVRYDDSVVGDAQNSIENTGSASLSYALLPKISTSGGVLLDDITYETADRGYTSYTVFGGASWSALPTLSFSGRLGASYVETVDSQSQPSIEPYGALTASWTLGARSSLSFNYAHEVTPSDQVNQNGQVSDRFGSSFRYQIFTRLSAHLDGTFTSSTSTAGLSTTNQHASTSYEEYVYSVDAGLTYSYNNFLSFDSGVTLSGVDSNIDNNNYTRDEVYIGVRGTY